MPGLLLIFLIASGERGAAQPPARVVVAKAVSREISAGQTFVATVLPLKRAVIGSAVDGRVVTLPVREGDRVEPFDPLATLLTSTIELELAAAEAELDLRKSELAELRNGLRPNEIAQAKAKMLAAEADRSYSTGRRDRLRDLRNSRAVSPEEFEEAVAAATRLEQNYADLKAAYELAVEGPRPERIAQAVAQVAMQQAFADRIRDRIAKHTIISRFVGYLVTRFVEEGSWVMTGDPVVEVAMLDELYVEALVAEKHVPHIHPGMHVRVEIPSLPDHLFSGVVSAVIPQADTRARTFPVRIQLTNEITETGPLIKAGMYARVELPTGERQQAVMVPKDALVLGGAQPVIFVAEQVEGDTAEARMVSVEPGVASPNEIQVIGDIRPGQLVVVEGNERLQPGRKLIMVGEPRESGASTNGQPEG